MGAKASKAKEKGTSRRVETPGSLASGLATVSGSKISPATEGQRQLLADSRSLSQLATLLGVGKSTVGHWRTGARVPERKERLLLEAHLGIPLASWDRPPATCQEPASHTGSKCEAPEGVDEDDEQSGVFAVVKQLRERRLEAEAANDERQWAEWACAERLCLESQAQSLVAEVGDLDRLRCSPSYGAVRAAVLATIDDGALRDVVAPLLPAQPTAGPLVELEAVRADLGALATAAAARTVTAVENVTAREVTGLLRVEIDCRKVAAKFGSLVAPRELSESRPWLAIASALSGALRGFAAARIAVLSALETLAANPLATVLGDLLSKVRHIFFPSEEFRDDPVRFCREVLGFEPWSRQRDILEAIRDNKYVAIRSGQKTGKSRIVGAAAIWWYCVWPDAAVLFSNSTGKQLDGINWKEIKHLVNDSGRCQACVENDPKGPVPCQHSQVVDGELLKSARGGLHSGKRSVLGIQAKDAEGIQGFSGAHLLIIVDEASSLSADLFQAFFGNTAASGAKMVMVSNPTRQSGPFFDAFHKNKSRWLTIQISSLEAATEGVPGLASMQYCLDVLASDERGEKSPFYQVRVLGEFPSKDTAAIYQLETVLVAQEQWETTEPSGRLVIAIDPAGESGSGDEIGVCWGGGDKIEGLELGLGWGIDRYGLEVMRIITDNGSRYEGKPLVAVDADGVGYEVHRALRALREETQAFDLVPIYFGHDALDWRNYVTTGDEAHVCFARWLRGGGTISRSWSKLEDELRFMQWVPVRKKRYERELELFSGTRKNDVRKELHRSPDSLDCCRIWAYAQTKRQASQSVTTPIKEETKKPTAYETRDRAVRAMDPYKGMSKWNR
jgi:transcriptional regulator with XRE-family HTH domain